MAELLKQWPTNCPLCHQPLVRPVGKKSSAFAIVTEQSLCYDKWDKWDRGESAAQRILYQELQRLSIPMEEILVAALWYHPMPAVESTLETDFHVKLLLRALAPAQKVLLLGKAATYFTGKSNDNTNSVWLTVPLLPNKQVMTAPALREVAYQVVGELRLSLTHFFKDYYG